MLGKDVSKLTDWNDSLREDSPYEPRLSHATTYGLKTRSNMSLFKYGVTDVSSEDSNDNILGQFVSDSVNMRTVRLFIDYDKFSNPFFKFKKQKNNSTTCKTDGMPTENTETRELKEELRFSITINPPSNKFPYNRSKPEFVSYSKLIGDKPLEPPKIVTPVEPEKVQEAPPPDPRTVIPPGTYYMYEMTQAVNNDESLDPKMSQAFKAHVVQNHQNLHELLSAVAKEKPLAVPEKPVLPADLGRSSLPDKSKLLLVLDIDETIVHVVRSNEKIPHQHSFSVRKAGFPNLEVKFNLRPWAREFLVEMKKYCHVALMTASHKSYAEQMQQFLDPKKEVLCAVFSKDHCVNYPKGR